jgi:hypothetical protein
MPWKESSVMEQRLHFVARPLDGEQMTVLCHEFGISRKTGYKIPDRYKEHGGSFSSRKIRNLHCDVTQYSARCIFSVHAGVEAIRSGKCRSVAIGLARVPATAPRRPW